VNEQNRLFFGFFMFFLIKITHFSSKTLAFVKNTLFLSGQSLTTNYTKR